MNSYKSAAEAFDRLAEAMNVECTECGASVPADDAHWTPDCSDVCPSCCPVCKETSS